jgi:hypothetical protein
MKKIEKSIKFDGINFKKKSIKEWNFHKIVLFFDKNLWKIEFYYISDIDEKKYYLPVFKLNIFLNEDFLLSNTSKEKAIKFLNNIFECFDWLNEKEYLIDIDRDLYFEKWFFKTKRRPNYDFSNIDDIKDDFESKNWMQILKDFIIKFQDKKYILTRQNANEYHKLHWILLYFIYLVFLVYQTIEETEKAKKELLLVDVEWIYEWQVDLMNERLNYVDELNRDTFERYKRRLELFFKMF